MATRVVRSFSKEKSDFGSAINNRTVLRYFQPEAEHSFEKFGLDSEVKIGRADLEKLGWPSRIKVVIYNLD